MEIILGLDIGKSRTGIARSDALGIIIKPLKTIETNSLLEELELLAGDFEISKFIIGLPLNPQTGNQEMQSFVESKVTEIKAQYPKSEIHLINESFSSREAESIIKNQGIKINKDNKKLVDMYAAAILLEDYFRVNA